MRALWIAILLTMLAPRVSATTFSFDTDPFAGTDALTTPGRQIVGGEAFVSFSIATDVFAFDGSVFGIGSQIVFANDEAASLPTAGVNVVVLQTLDQDGDPNTPFLAGTAANAIAARIVDPGPGFFVYFNSGLGMPRLVYSTDLSDPTADLKVLARLTNLAGQPGALPQFTADNFAVTPAIPEPSGFVLMAGALLLVRRAR